MGDSMDRLVRRVCALAAITALAMLAGCSSFGGPKLEVPRLTLMRVSTTSADMFSQQFLVKMNVENPNDQELPVKAIDYKLFFEGDSFAEGMSKRAFVVPAKGEIEVDMTVTSNFVSALGRLLTRLNGRDQINYVFEGTLMTEAKSAKKIPFQETGSVQFTRMR
jgi:LEA14-like dessication related protein